ncbi:saccharopine dehydrogenase family protein [Portibacter marinus]|uniref:saccharopine dehydrogenase family protein n=1 Tax=Portibacter marinus TaxID=2898660 RepID=UPI001F30DC8F|nr:saccharopine dehydrogenase NADP-binding domain-containing protein [Portibacter marinus]
MKYLLYGANGYTAKLIIEEALRRQHDIILAGRSKDKILAVARQYDLPYRIFNLDGATKTFINDVDAVLNAAGPFAKTAEPLVKACLASGTHYLDITGEVEVFETLKQYHDQAKEKDMMILPGIGFDVIPTDCLAVYLKEQMPDATHLQLAFTSENSVMSHGTAITAVSKLGENGLTRENGVLKEVRIAHKHMEVDFGEVKRIVGTIPWGDVSTAYTSTGIPNIEVYTAMPASTIRMMKLSWLINPILRTSWVKSLAKKWVNKNLTGPDEEQNQKGFALLYGKVCNNHNEIVARLKCPEVYRFTALASCEIMDKVLKSKIKVGYQTPATTYGWQFINEIEGCRFYEI